MQSRQTTRTHAWRFIELPADGLKASLDELFRVVADAPRCVPCKLGRSASLRARLRQRGRNLFFSLPSANPSARFPRLGTRWANSLPRLRRWRLVSDSGSWLPDAFWRSSEAISCTSAAKAEFSSFTPGIDAHSTPSLCSVAHCVMMAGRQNCDA